MRLFVILTMTTATLGWAKPISPVLAAPTPEAIKAVLTKGANFSVAESSYTFAADGSLTAFGIYGAKGSGNWKLSGTIVSGEGAGSMTLGCPRGCPWRFSFRWDVRAVGEGMLAVKALDDTSEQIGIPETAVLLVCRGSDRVRCTPLGHSSELSVAIIPANAKRGLYDATRKFFGAWSSQLAQRATLIDAEPAKTPRAASEIYFADGSEHSARTLASELEPTLGPVVVKQWPSPTWFEVLVVVGADVAAPQREAAPALTPGLPPVRVAISDGKCTEGVSDCTNALVNTVREKLGADFALTPTTSAKRARVDTEVWFKPGQEAVARKLAKDKLGELVKAENIKEWTWPGYFDVLIVVGGGAAK